MIVTERAAALLVYGFFFLRDDCDVDAGATTHTEVDTKKIERESGVGGQRGKREGMKTHKVKLTEILLQGKGVLFSTWQ